MQETVCCFLGHREIDENEALTLQVYSIVKKLIEEEKAATFLFGSKSRFNNLCYEQVTKLKEIYPHIKRVYVRAEFPQISESYKVYLLENYEDTYYPENVFGAGKAVYVMRNRTMIDRSPFCIVYCKKDYVSSSRKSGTKLALEYAIKKNKEIIILPG